MRRIVLWTFVLAVSGAGCVSSRPAKHNSSGPCPGYMQGHRKSSAGDCALDPTVIEPYTVSKPGDCPSGGCRFQAGFSKADITPPPGFPMGGNGFVAQFGRGYWTRLYARAFFFRDVKGQSLAFVTCDLGAMASALPAEVLWILNKAGNARGNRLNLSPENLILTATHVHQGPGNFLSFKLYNDVGSPAKGFDSDLFGKLAERIAGAIEDAASEAEEAAKTMTTELVLKEGKVKELLRNRAPEPFMLNFDRKEVLDAGPGPAYPCDPADPFVRDPYVMNCPRYNAVDERIAVLEIHRTLGGVDQHVGSMVFLSVHPEAMSNETQLYQADFTGLAMSLLERRDPDRKFVAGFFNGADGDISVRWTLQNRNEAVSFANQLISVIDNDLGPSLTVGAPEFCVARYEIPSNCSFIPAGQGQDARKPYCDPDFKRICLGSPMYGAATLGGAEDARSPLFDLGWKPGVRTEPWDVQGVKREGLKARFLPINLTSLLEKPCFFPETIPLSLVQLVGTSGSLSFGALPGELTRTAWWRIERRFQPDPKEPRGILPIGIANGYVGYVTTRQEYAAQGYEGSSTIFGPFEAELIEARLYDLSGKLHPPVMEAINVDELDFYPGDTDSFGPEREELMAGHGDPDEALENLILDEYGRPNRHWPRFDWREDGIDDWKAGQRKVEIFWDRQPNPAWDDDLGANVLTVYVNPEYGEGKGSRSSGTTRKPLKLIRRSGTSKSPKERRWTAIWLAPCYTNPDDNFYFRVTLADDNGTRLCSEPFTLTVVESRPPVAVKTGKCP
jgi:neutral ceramidase